MDAFDTELLSEEEAEALKATEPPASDEPGPTPDEPKVDTEPSPPALEKKPEDITPAPEKKLEPPPTPEPEKKLPIDGILAKDGKNVIPFTVLEEERGKRQALEAEIAELRKKPPEPAKVQPPAPTPTPKVELPPPIDFKEIAKKAYESEEGMAEALQKMFEAGKQVATQVSTQISTSTVTEATAENDFKREALRIKSANPWITPGFIEDSITNRAMILMNERGVKDVSGAVKASEEAVAEAKAQFRVDEPKIDIKAEVEKATKAAYDKAVKDVMAKFNITEPGAVPTLAGVRNVNPDVLNKFDEIDRLNGLEYEEALGQLKPEEREAYLSRADA